MCVHSRCALSNIRAVHSTCEKYHYTPAGVAGGGDFRGCLAVLGTCSGAVVVVDGADVAGIALRIDDVVVNGYAVRIARFIDVVGSIHERVLGIVGGGVGRVVRYLCGNGGGSGTNEGQNEGENRGDDDHEWCSFCTSRDSGLGV